MNPQTYATLRERIVKIVPEITELKFGCRINDDEIFLSDDDGEIGNCVGHTFTPEDNQTRIILVDHKENGELETLQDLIDSGDMEILGRDITLADVLRTIPHIEPFIRGNAESQGNVNFVTAIEKWNLAFPLHEQSDELGEWLMTIIV